MSEINEPLFFINSDILHMAHFTAYYDTSNCFDIEVENHYLQKIKLACQGDSVKATFNNNNNRYLVSFTAV